MRPAWVFLAVPAAFLLTCAEGGGAMPETVTNSIGMRLARIAPGTFEMGQAEGGDFDERPVHRVALTRPFAMGATEVTNAQYEQFDPAHRALRGKLGFSKGDDEAVVFVSWHDAVGFCEWLSKKDGKPYRLPTEAEWEYACRAGTTTPYHTGDALPEAFRKNVRDSWYPSSADAKEAVPLAVGQTPPNAWGLADMHGNVEEWCHDWYGPYEPGDATDPVGRASGDFRVTRGGSHSTPLEYLRSANRSGTVPEDRHWLIGFRVVQGEMPPTSPLPPPPPPRWARDVAPRPRGVLAKGPDAGKPHFGGPRPYVRLPKGETGPFYPHNHDPALVDCPNGDLLAIWYSCRKEDGRELAILASRLRHGADEWDEASVFWDAPDRNDHAPALWHDGAGTIWHFNGLSVAATWGNLALVARTSSDSGATWSAARLMAPEHAMRHQPVESVFRTREGFIILPCDAVPGGSGGTAIHVSRDGGKTWTDPGVGRPAPKFAPGQAGAWIAGIHAGIVQLTDGRLLALGRGDSIDGGMPMSLSGDMGQTWTYRASPFPPIGSGQRLALTRLREGPILLCSFAKKMVMKDAAGADREVSGLYAALSFDEGETWPTRRLVIPGGAAADQAEGGGYLSVCQTADGVVQLITSRNHYAFNLAWLKEPMPAR